LGRNCPITPSASLVKVFIAVSGSELQCGATPVARADTPHPSEAVVFCIQRKPEQWVRESVAIYDGLIGCNSRRPRVSRRGNDRQYSLSNLSRPQHPLQLSGQKSPLLVDHNQFLLNARSRPGPCAGPPQKIQDSSQR
jgi:hypothetical protein